MVTPCHTYRTHGLTLSHLPDQPLPQEARPHLGALPARLPQMGQMGQMRQMGGAERKNIEKLCFSACLPQIAHDKYEEAATLVDWMPEIEVPEIKVSKIKAMMGEPTAVGGAVGGAATVAQVGLTAG